MMRGRSFLVAVLVAALAFPGGIAYAQEGGEKKPAAGAAQAASSDATKPAAKAKGKKSRKGRLAKGKKRGKKLAKKGQRRGKRGKKARAGRGKGAKGKKSSGLRPPADASVVAVLRGNMVVEQALVHKNGAPRLKNFADLRNAISGRKLARIVETQAVRLDPTFGEFGSADERRLLAHVRPEANAFLKTLCGELLRSAREPCRVSSAVRPMDYQERVRLRNVQAVRASLSSHPSGYTFDLRTAGMPARAARHLDRLLAAYKRQGRIYVALEPGARHILVVRHFRAS